MSAPRVLYSFPHVLGRPGGIGWTAWQQAQGLSREGVEVVVQCSSAEPPQAPLFELHEHMRLLGLRVPHRLLGARRLSALHERRVRRFLARGGIDLLHCWPSASLASLRAARELGVPTLLERPSAHTRYVYETVARECERIGYELPEGHYDRYDREILEREEEEFALADRLLCPSEFVKRTFLQQGFPAGKLLRHRYGYDPALFGGSVLSPARGPLKIAFVGECGPRKGLHLALEAWFGSGLSRAGELHIVGRFLPGYRKLLGPRLEHSSVRCLGQLQDVGAVLRSCHALVLPSLAEGSALVTYEAQASGCTLLVSDASGACCRHMEDALVHPAGDVETLTRHLSRLRLERELLDRLRLASLEAARRLAWQDAAAVLAGAYRQALPAPAEAPAKSPAVARA